MKPKSIASKLIATLLILQTGLSFAQETTPRPLTPNPLPPPSLNRDIFHGARITVVTIAAPTLRQPCLVNTFLAETIVCAGKPGNAAAVYKQGDLVAVLKDNGYESHFSFKRFFAEFGLGGGAIAGAAFLASASTVAAIPIAVIGAVFLLASSVEALEDMDRGPRERVIYLNPNQQLQLALK